MVAPAERSAQGVSDLVVVASALADVLVRVLLLSPLSECMTLLFYINNYRSAVSF